MNHPPLNPAIACMNEAQEQMATFAALMQVAQTVLNQSQQAFEKANATSTTANCPQLVASLREHYSALFHLTKAISHSLQTPSLQRMVIATSQEVLRYPAIFSCLTEPEQKVICAGIASLLGYSHSNFLNQQDGDIAERLLETTCEGYSQLQPF
ncbi:MAG: hypothetical protein ACM37W_22965 [Actinomycetota bacterium]